MALNLSRIFKGKSPAEGVVTDNVDPDELGAPQPNPLVVEDHIDMIGAPDLGVLMKAGNDNITLENYRSANPGSDGVKWEGPDFDAAKSEVVYNGHAGLGANAVEPGRLEFPNLARNTQGFVFDDTDGAESINLGDTGTHLEQENGGLDTVDEEPLFDEADALFGKGAQTARVLDAPGSGSFEQVQAQYNPKELSVDKFQDDEGRGISERIDFPSYAKDGTRSALPEVDDEVLVQFNQAQGGASGIHDIHMNQGNSYTATDDLWKFTNEADAGAGGNEAARTMGPGQPGEGFMSQDSELYPRGLRDMEIDLGKSGAIIQKVEGNFESDGGSGGFLSQLNPGRPEAQGWYVPELDADTSAMAVADNVLGNFEIQGLTNAGSKPDGFVLDLEGEMAGHLAMDGSAGGQTERTAGPGDGLVDNENLPIGGFASQTQPHADGYTATDDLWKFASDKSPTSTGDQPELQAAGGDDAGRPHESLSLNLKEAGLGGPDTTEGFVLDLGGAFGGVKDDESAAGGDNARTAGPGPGENFRPNPTGDGTTQHFSSGQDARIDRQFQAMPELDANTDGVGYIGETEKNLEQKVIRDGKLTDNEFRDDQGTNPGFQSAEGRTMDFELGVAGRQEFQAMPELDASGNSFVDAADYTVWRDNLRASNPPEGILPFIEQNNLVGGERFTASEEQLKTLMSNLQEKGLIDTSTGEIVWGVGDGSPSPTGLSEANQLLDWLRATQPPVIHVEDGLGAPEDGSPAPTGISETNKILDFMPGNQPPGEAGEDGFVAPGDVAGMKFRFEGLPGDTDYAVTPDGGDTERSMGPGGQGFFRPNPAGDGTTEQFKSVGGLSMETEVVSPSNPGISEDMAEIVLNATSDTDKGASQLDRGNLPPSVAEVETAIPAVVGSSTGNASKNEVSIETLENREDIADRVTDYREGGVNDTTHIAFDDDGPATFLDGIRDGGLGGDEAGTLKVEWITQLDASQHNQTDIEFAIDDLDTDVDVP